MLSTDPPRPPPTPSQRAPVHDETEVTPPRGQVLDDGAPARYPKAGRRQHDAELAIPNSMQLAWLHKYMKDFGVPVGIAVMNTFVFGGLCVWLVMGLKVEMKEGRESQAAADVRRSSEHNELVKEVQKISDALKAKEAAEKDAAIAALRSEVEGLRKAPAPGVTVSPGSSISIGAPPPAPPPPKRKR